MFGKIIVLGAKGYSLFKIFGEKNLPIKKIIIMFKLIAFLNMSI